MTVPWVDKTLSPWPSVPVNQQLVVDLFSANLESLAGKEEALRGLLNIVEPVFVALRDLWDYKPLDEALQEGLCDSERQGNESRNRTHRPVLEKVGT